MILPCHNLGKASEEIGSDFELKMLKKILPKGSRRTTQFPQQRILTIFFSYVTPAHLSCSIPNQMLSAHAALAFREGVRRNMCRRSSKP